MSEKKTFSPLLREVGRGRKRGKFGIPPSDGKMDLPFSPPPPPSFSPLAIPRNAVRNGRPVTEPEKKVSSSVKATKNEGVGGVGGKSRAASGREERKEKKSFFPLSSSFSSLPVTVHGGNFFLNATVAAAGLSQPPELALPTVEPPSTWRTACRQQEV